MHPYFTIGLWFVLGATCGLIAHRKGRNPYLWFFVGLFFGLLGILTLYFVSRKRKIREEPTVVQQEETIEFAPVVPAEMQKFWYYLDKNHQQCGPVSFHALQQEITQSSLPTSTYVWNEDFENWKQIKDLPLFSEQLPLQN